MRFYLVATFTICAAMSGLLRGRVSAQGLASPPTFVLDCGKAGSLTADTTADEVYKLFGRHRIKKVDLKLEGMPSPALEIRLDDPTAKRPSLIAELVPSHPDLVLRIRVLDGRCRTVNGLGVGSTLGQIRAQHSVRMLVGEGNVVANVQDLQMSFDFGSRWYPSVDLPDSACVESVLVLFPPPRLRQ